MSICSGVQLFWLRICSTISIEEMWPKCSHGDNPLTAELSTLFRSRWYLSKLLVKKFASFLFAVVRPPLAILTGSTVWSTSIADSALRPTEPPSEQRHNHSNGGSFTLQPSIMDENSSSLIIRLLFFGSGFLFGHVSGHRLKLA